MVTTTLIVRITGSCIFTVKMFKKCCVCFSRRSNNVTHEDRKYLWAETLFDLIMESLAVKVYM